MTPRFYVGEVMHRRMGAVKRRFAYRVFSMLVELDDLPALAQRCRFFSHNRFNLLSFHDRDHGRCDGGPVRPWVEAILATHGMIATQIQLLCFPRILGYVFNPLSIYFCRDASDRVTAILYEVRNTFGDKHCYLMAVPADRPRSAPIVQACDKEFHVSPFLPIEGGYRFRLSEPDEKLAILIRYVQGENDVLVATQTGRAEPIDDAAILRNLFRHPLMTLKVMAAIHWEALRLWLRGARFHRRPEPPAFEVTYGSAVVPRVRAEAR